MTASAPEKQHPDVNDADIQAVVRVLTGSPGDLGGPHSRHNRDLETAFADYVGTRYCLSLPSGTAALSVSLIVHGIGHGHRIIVSGLTWMAQAMEALNLGIGVDFCDIDPETFNMDPLKAEALITPATRAIVVTHAHGLPADMDAFANLCEHHGLVLIEDAAQAAGALYHGAMAGSIGATGCFSFNLKKPLTGGDGGALTTNDERVYDAAVRYANFGQEPGPPPGPDEFASHWPRWLGTNLRLHPMVAALVRSQLARLPHYLETAQRNADILTSVGDLDGFTPPHIPKHHTSTHHLWRVLIDPDAFDWQGSPRELRNRIVRKLNEHGVPAAFWNHGPQDHLPAFRRMTPSPRTIHSDDKDPLRPPNPDALPVTNDVINRSLVLGRAPDTLQVLPQDRVSNYVEIFQHISDHPEILHEGDFGPLRLHPPVPELARED